MAALGAFAIALVLHLIFFLNVTLKYVPPEKSPLLMEVTLMTKSSPIKPPKSDFMAIENQMASQVTPEMPKPARVETVAVQQPKPKKETHTPKIIPPPKTEIPKHTEKITIKVKPSKPEKIEHPIVEKIETKEKSRLSPELLQQQISQLGSRIREQQMSSDDQRMKFVDAVSASKHIAAQYLQDWESKVERTGNMNYPEVAMQKDFSGTLTMDVGIKADGSIYSLRINKSSGNPALDEAAKKIVRMSAPFAPLPIELLKELDVLVITRVWKFSDQSGLTTQ